uniref:Uncharacterized protein n=1 Tax=Anguilla anguilla TaxID=7936 RepID=A0A0E9TRR6_ANGAN
MNTNMIQTKTAYNHIAIYKSYVCFILQRKNDKYT